jgi:nucleotide-binding universal stress UspA family protein
MKKILVPVDLSSQSNEAYTVALQWAQMSQGEIVLVHVLAPPSAYTGLAGETIAYDMTFFTQMEADVQKGLQKMKEQAGSVPVSTEVIYGDLVSGIASIIEKKKIDFIIMGTAGASGLTEIFIGSNTEKVVRFASVPVLAVRKSLPIKSIKNILVPSTLDLNQHDFIQKLSALQSFLNATLHILLINTPVHFKRDAEANEALQEFVKHYKLSNYKLHFRNYIREEDGIIDFTYTEKMDLIAMATHARKGLAHLFNSSITENTVNHIEAPIWTYCLKR